MTTYRATRRSQSGVETGRNNHVPSKAESVRTDLVVRPVHPSAQDLGWYQNLDPLASAVRRQFRFFYLLGPLFEPSAMRERSLVPKRSLTTYHHPRESALLGVERVVTFESQKVDRLSVRDEGHGVIGDRGVCQGALDGRPPSSRS